MTIPADQVSYADLYKRWEQGNWRATDLDLSTDREQSEPWHLILANGGPPGAGGANSATPGRIADPDLTFRCVFSDWIDLAAGRTDPVKALLLRHVRITGKLWMLARARKLFP